ncbi:carboxypeptidase regulatory-like domain-containing protein [Lutibacter sp. B2]|nr:carboxypeptidase regulatory-like domain-containing protein [Lutibacter sp. B2]
MGARLVKFSFKPEENEQIEAIVQVPKEPRSVIDGVVKDWNGRVVKDAVVKLFEVINPPCELKPLTHTFTDESGQFLFGPLSPKKRYVIKVWINDIKIRNLLIEPDVDDPLDCICEKENVKDFEEEEI